MNEREYDKGMNEGGYGYNPYRVERERKQLEERPRHEKRDWEKPLPCENVYPDRPVKITMAKEDEAFKALALAIVDEKESEMSINTSDVEAKIDALIEDMEDPLELEDWAEKHGNNIDLSEYRGGDGTGDDSLPEDVEQPTYAVVETDERGAWIGIVGNAIRVVGVNHGNCGNTFAARVWDVDFEELGII